MNKTEWMYVYDVETLIDVTHVKNTSDSGDSYFHKTFDPNTEIAFYADADTKAEKTKIKSLEFGFAWPYEYGNTPADVANYDELANKVASNTGSKNLFNITYTVSIEQDQ